MRLGNPLNCKLDELQSPNYIPSLNSDKLTTISESEEVGANVSGGDEVDFPCLNDLRVLEDQTSFGNQLSVAKIQSLVSMATLRAGGLNGTRDCPPFVEFDMSIGGFAYLFLPSVFPYSSGTVPATSIIHGSTDKGFPPVNGITFASWLCIDRCSVPEESDPSFSLLSLFVTYKMVNKKRHSFLCLEIFLCPKNKVLIVSTQQQKFRSRPGSQSEETGNSARKQEKGKDAVYHCPSLFEEGRWHHVAVVLNKTVLRGCMASLHIDGHLEKSQRVSHEYVWCDPKSEGFVADKQHSYQKFTSVKPLWLPTL